MKTKEISIADIWNEEKLNSLQHFIFIESARQSKERILKNELLAIQYRMEDYIASIRYY